MVLFTYLQHCTQHHVTSPIIDHTGGTKIKNDIQIIGMAIIMIRSCCFHCAE